MNPEYFSLLYDYNSWANHRLLDACAPLTGEQFTRELRSSFSSARDTLAHIAGVEWLYLERFHGRSRSRILPRTDYPDLAALRTRWAEIEEGLRTFVGSRKPPDLGREIAYRNTRGIPYSNLLSALMQHLVNHSTYHRGQVTTLLRQLGAKAATLDLIYYFRDKSTTYPHAEVDPETLRTLHEYDAWANERMLSTCGRLTAEQFGRDLASSFPSVRDTVTHILGAQWVWLERFHGRMPTAFPERDTRLETLRDFSKELSKGLKQYAGAVPSTSLAGQHAYRTFAGASYSNPLWISQRHLVNHGTYHRGQVTTMLRQLGAETFPNDLTYFFRERAGLPLK